MTNIQIRLESTLKEQAQAVAQGMGLDLSAAVRLFLTQMVRENGLPFRPVSDPFLSGQNQKRIQESIDQMETGQNVSKSLDELRSMEA
ncbi:MAG: type II toxin-antitoxin system antitoxin, RelB/DinJ family [Deltaproteobacteria bacterium]|nr:MAG: type II toxin-antitoxin system antitoxin, RelB/DinJ family [Deltaproteobacteria bacterium]